ncbi:unnamed protein product [Parnassius apollo]|uniref:(apollo) hypothetical protein n=1 Tax=Parnassius apollo TaxID=110799 RepID=A0A8S3XP65_PARAO|nr:unnamed protein product [Parnassius apollo]
MMKYPDFYDLKALEKSLNCNIVKNKTNETVKWMTIKWIQIPISKAKKKDLMTQMKDGVIPKDYVDYYTKIPSIDEENIINDCSSSESDD